VFIPFGYGYEAERMILGNLLMHGKDLLVACCLVCRDATQASRRQFEDNRCKPETFKKSFEGFKGV
jgi:hypothetical protein